MLSSGSGLIAQDCTGRELYGRADPAGSAGPWAVASLLSLVQISVLLLWTAKGRNKRGQTGGNSSLQHE